jgi:hypothetical protein
MEARIQNRVFFDLFAAALIHYPESYALPVAALVLLSIIGLVIAGIKKGRLTAFGVALGFVSLILSLIIVVILVKLAWTAVISVHQGYLTLLQGDTYNSSIYFLAFTALTLAGASAVFVLVRKKASLESIWAGSLVLLGLLGLLSSLYLPGGSYLLAWPLVAAIGGLALVCFSPVRNKKGLRFAVLLASAAPAVVLFTPMLYQIALAVTVSSAEMAAAALVLMLGVVVPVLNPSDGPRKWLPPAMLALTSLIFFVAGSSTSGFDRDRPRPDNLFYAVAKDADKAFWATADAELDEWTSRFFDESSVRETFTDVLPLSRRLYLKNEAPVAAVAEPELVLQEESVAEGTRTLRLRLTTQAPVYSVSIYMSADSRIDEARVNGRLASSGSAGQWALTYTAPPQDGIDLELTAGQTQRLNLVVVARQAGLPRSGGVAYSPRPDHLIPSLMFPGDMTLVSKSFSF